MDLMGSPTARHAFSMALTGNAGDAGCISPILNSNNTGGNGYARIASWIYGMKKNPGVIICLNAIAIVKDARGAEEKPIHSTCGMEGGCA